MEITKIGKINDGLGTLRKLAPELRIMVYQLALDEFQQIFQIRRPSGVFVLSTADTPTMAEQYGNIRCLRRGKPKALPNLMRVSNELRAEVLDSAFSKHTCSIVAGQNHITTNFPLTVIDNPNEQLTFDKALVPRCRELFIGIEMPSPRAIKNISELRLVMKQLTVLLNTVAIAPHTKKFPQIRVSFESDAHRAGLSYYRNDFETLVAPLYKLRLPPQDDAYNTHRALLIDRSCRWLTLDKRHDTCRMIEDAVQDPSHTRQSLIYHQLSIDIRLDLALLLCHAAGEYRLSEPPRAANRRLTTACKDFIAWHRSNRFKHHGWIDELLAICEAQGPREAELEDVVHRVVGPRSGPVFRQIVHWVEGHLSIVNPFWKE
jgi:hypothetical protein